MISIKKVLVTTDFSTDAWTALEYGRELSRTFGATLHLLHVVEDVTVQFMVAGSVPYGLSAADAQRELEDAAQAELDRLVREDDRRELGAKAVIRVSSTVAGGIVDYAAKEEIDLIVIGTHGRGGMARLLMGSVAERVVRTAPCPVLTVRNPEREFLRPDALHRRESEGTSSGENAAQG